MKYILIFVIKERLLILLIYFIYGDAMKEYFDFFNCETNSEKVWCSIGNLREHLMAREKLLSKIFNVANIGISIVSEEGLYEFVNDVYSSIYGYSREELLGQSFTLVVEEGKKDEALKTHKDFILGKTEYKSEWKGIQKQGKPIHLYISAGCISMKDGKKYKVTAVADVTEMKEANQRFNLVSSAFSNASEGICFTSSNPSEIVYCNEAFRKITQVHEEDFHSRSNNLLKCSLENNEFHKNIYNKLHKDGIWHGKVRAKRPSGEGYIMDITINTIKNSYQEITNYVAIINEITDKIKDKERIKYLSTYSSLTNLPNRQIFENKVDKATTIASKLKEELALVIVDIDRFKSVNDTYGLNVGDMLLKAIGARIKNSLLNKGVLSYLGEDHFGILIENVEEIDCVVKIAEDIQRVISKGFNLHNATIDITSSIGISIFPNRNHNPQDLLIEAEKAVLEAKNYGRNCIKIFTEEMNKKFLRKTQIENELKTCIEKNELFLVYQPQIELKEESMVGVEALLRWKNSKLGLISPFEFIPIAEEMGMIDKIGRWVIKNVCYQIKKWEVTGIPFFKVAINISPLQLKSRSICKFIKNTIAENSIDARMLELEITEGCMIQDIEKSISIFSELKEIGIKIAIDDFGTGYSSLSYLRKIPINKIKIDRSFIMDLNYKQESSIITKTIIVMGKNLGYKVIAEGVENKHQLQVLKDNGCDEVQGYYYSKPLMPEELERFIKIRQNNH